MKINKDKALDYFTLAIRVLLSYTFLNYGYAKLAGNQFGVSAKDMTMPLKDLGTFKLFWYLMDQNPFKYFIGISQIITGILMLINRTMLIGLFLYLVIIINILIMDITYLKMPGFYDRLGWYILLDLFVLYRNRIRVIKAFKTLTDKFSFQYKFPIWAYLLLPFCAIMLEITGMVPRLVYFLILSPTELIHSMKVLIEKLFHS